MEDRKKFTYRYDDETEKLLTEGLEKFNFSSLNKLIDKLMSRNYHEYKQAERQEDTIRVKPSAEAPDDLGALSDYQPI